MSTINVGAFIDGTRAASKKALREALRDNPASVRFDATTAIGPDVGAEFTGDALPQDRMLVVVGPNPYNARNWYANVELTGKGVRFDRKAIPAAKPAGGGAAGAVKLSGLTDLQTKALRETLTPDELEGVTLTTTTATFTREPGAMLAIVEAAQRRAAEAHGGGAHPARSLHPVIRKLRAIAARAAVPAT